MARDDLGLFVPGGPGQGPKPNPVEQFNKQNQFATAEAIIRKDREQAAPGTRVDQVEEKVGGYIRQAAETPIIGSLINPMLWVTEKIDDTFIEPLFEEAAALSPEMLAQVAKRNPNGNFITNWRLSREYANDVSLGQAWSKPFTSLLLRASQTAGNAGMRGAGTAAELVLKNKPWMAEDFDLLDADERDAAFRDDLLGIAISGGLDLTAMAIGSKGAGVAFRGARKAAFGKRTIDSQQDMQQFSARLDKSVEELNAGATPGLFSNATTKFMADAVAEKDSTRLLNNPLVAASNNPYRASVILSRLDNATDVADYLKAERGDAAALERLFKSQASAADALSNHGVKMDPLTDWQQIHALPDAAQAGRLAAVLSDIRKRDPDLANALDSFGAEKGTGVSISSYQPTKLALIEKFNSTRTRMKTMNIFGDAELFGRARDTDMGGWRTKLYQSSPYDRAVRVITWASSGRPQGHINITNPRRYEATYDILSELNRLDFLKGRKGADFKRRLMDDWNAAATDSDRAAFLARMERQVIMEMADAYGVRGIKSVRDKSDLQLVEQFEDWYKQTAGNRSSAREFLNQYKLIPDEDGNINVVQLGIRANDPNTLPILDFKRLEMEVVRQVNRADKSGGYAGTKPFGRGRTASSNIQRASMGFNTFLDLMNMTFSNLNLLRLAYIPKNSMTDPYLRASMDLESIYGVREGLKGTFNFFYNRGLIFRSGWRRAQWMVSTPEGKARSLRTARKDFETAMKSFEADRISVQNLERSLNGLAKERLKQEELLMKTRRRLEEAKNPESVNRLRERLAKRGSEYTQFMARYNSTLQDLNTRRSAVQAAAPSLALLRKDLLDKETSLATIRSKRKRIGEDDFTMVVDGQTITIPGLANPNVKGANAYISSISAFEDGFAASRRSELGNRILASRAEWKKISRDDWESYTNAITHIANRQLRSELDEVGGMVLRGAKVKDIMEYLYSPAGRQYLRTMIPRLPDTSRAGVQAWVEATRADILRMFPDEQMRNIILERDITPDEVNAFLAGRTDIPDNIMGPDIASSLSEKIRREADTGAGRVNAYASSAVTQVTDVGWKILSGVENRLVRNGLFMRYVADEMQQQARAAKRAGFDITDQMVHLQLRQQAYRSAVERLEQTLYSARRLTNSGYIMRYLMAFPSAFYNSQVTAARLLMKNPANAMWYANVTELMDGFNPYMDDEGNSYSKIEDIPAGKSVSLQFPLYDSLNIIPFAGKHLQGFYKQHMGLYTDPRGGGTKVNPKQMEFMLGDPSVSWIGSILLSHAIKEGLSVGPWKIYGEQIDNAIRQAAGDDVYEQSILFQGRPVEGDNIVETTANAMIPTYMKSLEGGLAGLREDPNGLFGRRFGSDVAANTRFSISEAARNGEEPPKPIDIIRATGVMSFIKAFVQFNAPISVSFDPVTRAATEQYQEFLDANSGNERLAEEQFIRAWGGIEAVALLGSSSRYAGGLGATRPDLSVYRKHSDLMYEMYESGQRNPTAAGMLSFGYGDDELEYDDVTAEIFRNSRFPGLTTQMIQGKTMEDYIADPERRMGWYEWNKLIAFRDYVIEQNDLGSTSSDAYRTSGLKEWVKAEENRMRQAYPAWANDLDEARSNFWTQTFQPLLIATDNEAWMADMANYGTKWSEIADWVAVTENFYTYYEQARLSPEGGKPDLMARKEKYAKWHYDFVNNASPEFQAFAERYLSNMPELNDIDEEDLVDE